MGEAYFLRAHYYFILAQLFGGVPVETTLRQLEVYVEIARRGNLTRAAEALGMSQSSLSHQLKLLKLNGLVKYRRDGRNIYYSLDDQHVVDVFNEGLEHITHRMREHQ